MSINKHEGSFETQALRKLFEQTQPEPKEVDIHAIVNTDRSDVSEQVERNCATTFRLWSSKMSFKAAALVAVTVGVLGLFIIPLTSAEKVAFAQVKERIDAIRTVEYIETSYGGSDRGPNEAKEFSLETAIEKLNLMLETADPKLAKDLEFELKLLSDLQTQKSKVFYVRRVRVKGRYLQRTDQIFPPGRNRVIRDASSGLTVAFHDDLKQKNVLTKQVAIDKTGGQQETDIPKIPPDVDFFSRFTSVPNGAVEQLPSQILNGKNVVGLRSQEERAGETWTRTYWIEPETRLPVEMWTELRKGEELRQRWVMNQFFYDNPMDDELFSTETPEGYSSSDGKVHGLSSE